MSIRVYRRSYTDKDILFYNFEAKQLSPEILKNILLNEVRKWQWIFYGFIGDALL